MVLTFFSRVTLLLVAIHNIFGWVGISWEINSMFSYESAVTAPQKQRGNLLHKMEAFSSSKY